MENQPGELPDNEANQNNLTGEQVSAQMTAINHINATQVTLRQAGVKEIFASSLNVRQGGMGKVKTENLEVIQAGAGLIQTNQAKITTSRVGVIVAGSNVNLDLSATKVLVAGGEVTMDQSATGVLVGNNVKVQNSPIIFLAARNVEGNVTATFGPQESLIFGAAAGLVAGVVLLLANLFRQHKKK